MSLDWELVDETLQKHITLQENFVSGYKEIRNLVKSETSVDLLKSVDVLRIQAEFRDWLVEVFTMQKLPREIKSLYFGLFVMKDPDVNAGDETTTIHVCGSTLTPGDDDDWACETAFLPEARYKVLTDFLVLTNQIRSKLEGDGALEILVFNGLLNLLLINAADRLRTLLQRKMDLIIGAGYDEGEPYVIGNLAAIMNSNGR